MTCSERLTFDEMTRLLKRMHQSCLVVLNNEGQFVGMVSEEKSGVRFEKVMSNAAIGKSKRGHTSRLTHFTYRH